MSGCDGHKRDVALIVVYMVLLVVAMFICFSEAKAEFEPSDAINQTRSQRKAYFRCFTGYGGSRYLLKRRKLVGRASYPYRKLIIKHTCRASRPMYLYWGRTSTHCVGGRFTVRHSGRNYSCRVRKIIAK